MLIEVSRIPPEGLDVALPTAELDLGDPTGPWEGPASVRAAMRLDRSGRGPIEDGCPVGGLDRVPVIASLSELPALI